MSAQAQNSKLQASVSIITPTFNRSHLLNRTWNSISKQSLQNFEWIVVDDGSTDGTCKVIQSFNDPRIKYIYQPNKGVNSARNHGERYVTAPYVIHLDSDDEFCTQESLATMTREIDLASADIGVVNFGVIEASSGAKKYAMAKARLLANYEDHVCENKFSGEFFAVYRRETLKLASWPADVSGLECLRHWEIARHNSVLFIDHPARIYHTLSGDNLSSATSAIKRAPSMAKATKRLIEQHQKIWLSKNPHQIGRYRFFLAMYEALSGTGSSAMNLLYALRWGDNRIKFKALILLAALAIPLLWRRQLFILRSRGR